MSSSKKFALIALAFVSLAVTASQAYQTDAVVPESELDEFDSGDCCGGTISDEDYRRVPNAAERGRHKKEDFSKVCKAKGDGCSEPCGAPVFTSNVWCKAGQVCMKSDQNHCVNLCSTRKNGFLNIGHMANTIRSVDWAISEGANAVEIDLQYDGTTPTKFQHSPDSAGLLNLDAACDCTCTLGIVMRPSRYICTASLNDDCKAQTPAVEMLTHLAEKNLALVYFDNKLDTQQDITWNDDDTTQAGEKAAALYKILFEQGHKGKALVGVGKIEAFGFLKAVKSVLDQTPYKDSVFYTIDMETKAGGAERSIAKLKELGTKNLIYSIGISACAASQYYGHISAGVKAKNAGDVQGVLIWTVDSRATMKKYLTRGVTGMLTNYPGYSQAEACQAGKALAIP